MFPEILIILLLSAVLICLVFSLFYGARWKVSPPDGETFPGSERESSPCPLCEKALYRGERVHSVVFRQGEDRLMNIYGCSWCYEEHPAGHHKPLRERHCPSCGTLLKEGSFAVARVFERPGRKTHVHVLGCPVCRNRR